MIIRIEIRDDADEPEIVVRCREVDDAVKRLHRLLLDEAAAPPSMIFQKEGEEFFFPVDRVLFFETDGDNVYAHTADDAYRVGLRLYELEEMLPSFARASKSALVNLAQIYSIHRDLTSSSPVQFHNSYKKIYISRRYYSEIRRRLGERSGKFDRK